MISQSLSYSSIKRSSSSNRASVLVGWGWLAESSPEGSWLFGRLGSVVALAGVDSGLRDWAAEESSFSLSASKMPGSLSLSASSLSLKIKTLVKPNLSNSITRSFNTFFNYYLTFQEPSFEKDGQHSGWRLFELILERWKIYSIEQNDKAKLRTIHF